MLDAPRHEHGVAATAISDGAEGPVRPRPFLQALASLEYLVASARFAQLLLLIGALWWAQTVLIPIVLSVLVSYALEPGVAKLESWHVRRVFGVPLLLGALLASGGETVYLLRGEAVAFANGLPQAAHQVAEAIGHKTSGTPGPVAKMQQAANELENAAGTNRKQPPKDGVTSVRIEEPTFKWGDWLWKGSHGAVDLAGQGFAVICLVYYLLVAGDMYKRKFVKMVGPSMSDKKLTVQIIDEIDRQIARFLWARIVISGIVGIAIWITFRFLGLDSPGVWGVISALLFAVPVFGPVVVILGAAVAGFVQFGTVGMAAAAAGATAVIAALEGNVLTPLLMSRVGEMNAVAVFVSLMFWGWMWGIWGLLLAVPITAAIKAVCERVDDLNPLAELLKSS